MAQDKPLLRSICAILVSGFLLGVADRGVAQDSPGSPGAPGGPSPSGTGDAEGGPGEPAGPAGGPAPETSIFRGLRFTPTITFRETFTDNVGLDPDGEKDPALISEVVPGIDLALRTSRLSWGLNGAVTLRYTAINEEGVDTEGNLATALTAEIAEDLFFVDAAASVSQELLDSEQGSSGSEANTNNLDTVQTYLVSPYLRNRFGDFMASELRYSFAYGNFGGDEASDTIDHQARLAVDAGPAFTTYLWGVDAFAASQTRDDDDNVERGSAELNMEIVVANSFSLLAAGGYNTFDDGEDGNEVDEPLWEAGFRWAPVQRSELIATYGERDGIMAPRGRLTHFFSPRTRIVADYSETLGTSQDLFCDNLRTVTLDEEGRLAERGTGLPFTASPTALSIDDRTSETKRASLRIVSELGRNVFDLGATYEDENTLSEDEDEDDDGDNVDEETFAVDVSWSRRLTPSWTGAISGSFSRSQFREDENDKNTEYTAGLTIAYAIVPGADLVGSYTFRLQDSTDPEDEFTENTVSLALVLRF